MPASRSSSFRRVGLPCRTSAVAAAALLAATLAGCAAGPDFVRPTVDTPPAFKEAGPWKAAEPQPADSRQPWWTAYRDDTLNGLMAQADASNQSLRQAEAQYRQARALVDQARASYWPTLGTGLDAGRARTDTNGLRLGNDYSLSATASWAPDLWGSVRRNVEAGEAGAQASADDLAAARLSIQAELAQDYLQLRVTDLQTELYAATAAAYERALKLTQSQYGAGVALRSDVALAESQYKSAQALAVDEQALRSQLEHAIAVLTGQAPARFSLPVQAHEGDAQAGIEALRARLPVTPAGLPSDLLERRPDIAAAERRVAQANADIGVARAAYFPSLVLSASGGFGSAAFGTLLDAPSRVWSLGSTLAQTLFDGGLRQARDAQAVAAYDASVASYRQTVLASFQAVEDNLATLRVLNDETGLQNDAVRAAQTAERLALQQYRAGTATYLSVITAQTQALSNERTAVQLLGRQLSASVALVAAIGGGWSASAPVLSSAPGFATSVAATADAAPISSVSP